MKTIAKFALLIAIIFVTEVGKNFKLLPPGALLFILPGVAGYLFYRILTKKALLGDKFYRIAAAIQFFIVCLGVPALFGGTQELLFNQILILLLFFWFVFDRSLLPSLIIVFSNSLILIQQVPDALKNISNVPTPQISALAGGWAIRIILIIIICYSMRKQLKHFYTRALSSTFLSDICLYLSAKKNIFSVSVFLAIITSFIMFYDGYLSHGEKTSAIQFFLILILTVFYFFYFIIASRAINIAHEGRKRLAFIAYCIGILTGVFYYYQYRIHFFGHWFGMCHQQYISFSILTALIMGLLFLIAGRLACAAPAWIASGYRKGTMQEK